MRCFFFQYFFQNIGGSAALQISLKDNSFPQELFTIAGGQLNVVLDRIPPFSNVTHVVVVRPKKYGMYNFTAAEVSYKSSESASSVSFGLTSHNIYFKTKCSIHSDQPVVDRGIEYRTTANTDTPLKDTVNMEGNKPVFHCSQDQFYILVMYLEAVRNNSRDPTKER